MDRARRAAPDAVRVTGKRSYHQHCALAYALDVVGERWTLLIARELLLGPRRFGELLDGLPGIARNLLSQRLTELERHGVVRRVAGDAGWELTDAGRELESLVVAGARWGGRWLGRGPAPEGTRVGWWIVSLRVSFNSQAAGDARHTWELRVDGQPYAIEVADGGVETLAGAANDPHAVFTTTLDDLLALLQRSVTPTQALAGGKVRLTGPPEELDRFVELFGWPGLPSDRTG